VRGGMRRPYGEHQRFNKPFESRRGGMRGPFNGPNQRNEAEN